MNLFKKLMLWITGLVVTLSLVVVIAGWTASKPGYQGPKSDHFNGNTFQNIGNVSSKNFFEVMKWSLNREPGVWEKTPEADLTFAKKPQALVTDSLVITYVNHSTFLIQVDGLNILTDPVWSERVSPVSFAGPKRMRPPGLKFEDLPDIDLVIISHNHYDHLDISTLKKLNALYAPDFVVPLGVDLYLNNARIQNTSALDWWGKDQISNSVIVTSVPAQHFSARGLFDRDKTLWSGYVLETPSGNIYFAGDTGYGSFFPDIGSRFDINVGLIPIGAYKPRWFMSPVHVDPEEAIQVHKEVKADISFGMHFGTFPLADDGMKDPENDFIKAMQLPENEGVNFKLLSEGDVFTMPNKN